MASFSDIGEIVIDSAEVEHLKSHIYELAYENLEQREALDGLVLSIPQVLSKRDLASLRKKTYWVSEKSDGERALLLSLETSAFLVDANMNFYRIPSDKFYLPRKGRVDVAQHKTLLDCMLVWNHAYARPCLMVIDVYAVEGVRVAEKFFRSRIEAIRESVVLPIRMKYPSEVDQVRAANPLVVLQGKEYWLADQIATVFGRINHHFEGSHRYIYHFEKRYNENDGIIFVPDERPLVPGFRDDLKKWKWPEMRTISFHLKIDRETRNDGRPPRMIYAASLEGPNRVLIAFREISFKKFDSDRILEELAKYLSEVEKQEVLPSDLNAFPYEHATECWYDPVQGDWQFYRLRTNGQVSSFSQAMVLMESTSDRLSKEDVIAAVGARTKSRPPSNPATPATPLTPATTHHHHQEKNNINEETGESPSPTLGSTTGTGGTKRPVEDVYHGERQPMNEPKRQRPNPEAGTLTH